MFSKGSRGKGFAEKVSALLSALLLAVFATAGSLVLAGCPQPADDPQEDSDITPLIGTWAGIDTFVISESVVDYNDGGYGMGFESAIRYVGNFDAASGVIIVEYTKAPTGSDDWPYTQAGNFQGIYYKDLTATAVKLAYAANPDYSAPETATLDLAKAKFTRAAADDLVSWGYVQPQTKQQ